MKNKKIFGLNFEKEIATDNEKLVDFLDFENDILKEFKNQMYNSKSKCKKCKKTVGRMVSSNIVFCPCCYSTVFKLVQTDKFSPSLINSEFINFFLSKDKNFIYKGKRPEYSMKYFDYEIKINDLKRELDYSIEIEDYEKCEVLKYTIEDIKNKQLKIRRDIDE